MKGDRYWAKVGKRTFLVLGIYVIAASFWCGSAGSAYKKRVLERDHQFHEASDKLEVLRLQAASEGDPSYVKARDEFIALGRSIERASAAEFSGIDAMGRSAAGAPVLIALCYGIGYVARRRTPKPQPAAA